MTTASTTPQLPLRLQLRDDARFDNFFPEGNESAFRAIQSQVTEHPLDNFMYLWGSSGSGTSHLLQACCFHGDAAGIASFYLSLSEVVDYGPEVLESLDSMDLLCIDELELLAGKTDWEQSLFHLFNRLRDQGKRLVVAANQSPAELPVGLPDLLSRLRSGLCFQLHVLSDEGKCQALIQRANLRGLQLNEEAAYYILSRHSRDTGALLNALDQLDEASLKEQRKLTIPFIKSVFNW